MKNLNEKLIALILIVSSIFAFKIHLSVASENGTDFILGKVVYSDDNTPVRNGNIEVYSVDEKNASERFIEKTLIQSNGEFKISKSLFNNSDRIKIMAYPNDLDNFENQFVAKTFELNPNSKYDKSEYDIVIAVERSNVKKSHGSDIDLFEK